MRILAISIGLLFLGHAAQAADINLLAPGLIGPGITAIAAAWKAKSGDNVVLSAGTPTIGKIEQIIATGGAADVVILPPGELATMTGKLKPGPAKKIGRVIFGVGVKTGAAHPDISSLEKFRAALQGKSVAYNDPASGSLAGKMVDAFLKQPGYAGVKAYPAKGTGGQAVADGKADIAVAVESEEVRIAGLDIVGPVPDAAGLTIDISGAVLANAAHPEEAAAFLAYMAGPEAAAILKPTGIAAPSP
jgi:molybdate transport system substrate-binding protein